MAKPTEVVFEISDEVVSGTLTAWLVAEGDVVEAGQSIAEIEGDKAAFEFPAPCAGTVLKLDVAVGAELERGDVIAWVGDATSTSVVAESLRIQIRAACPACGEHVAVNGPRPTLSCPQCGFAGPLPPSWWLTVIAAAARGETHLRSRSGAWRMSVLSARDAPACHNCGAALPVDLDTPMHEVSCSECGLRHAARPAPAWLMEADPTLVRCVGNVADVARPRPRACPQCGALVHPKTTAPTPRCHQCGADVTIPAWRAPLPRPWWLLRSRLRR